MNKLVNNFLSIKGFDLLLANYLYNYKFTLGLWKFLIEFFYGFFCCFGIPAS